MLHLKSNKTLVVEDMDNKQIAGFKAGDEVQSFFILRAMNIKTSSNNKKYLDLTLADKSGEINAKLWNIENGEENTFQTGQLVKVRGTVTLWQNSLQFKITKLRLAEDEDQVDVVDYVPAAPYPAEDMFEEVMSFINRIENEDVKNIVTRIYEMYKEPLMTAPAAKSNHHAVRSGLLYHMLRMLRSAEVLCGVYQNLNPDLVYAGVLLHDIEKINEMNSDDLGIVSEYTFDGQMLGHIIMGVKTIERVAHEVGADNETSMLLQHMVLTHHYEPEYGSPKKPMIPEAEMLHYLDMIDARMYDMCRVYDSMEEGDFSDPVFVLDRRRLYKSSMHRD